MSKFHLALIFITISLIAGFYAFRFLNSSHSFTLSGAPPYGESETEVPTNLDPYAWIKDWKRPEGPAKVGIQVGHWQSENFPEELKKLRGNTGASGGGKTEVEVNLAIAKELEAILISQGIHVDLLPATIPPKYWADVFIAIHADGNEDTTKSGYKFSGPWRDITGKTDALVNLLETEYAHVSGLETDLNISRNMRGYYAFAWWRYEHSIHPMTPGIIAETGFLTSPRDRKLIVDQPHIPARAIASALTAYLQSQKLI